MKSGAIGTIACGYARIVLPKVNHEGQDNDIASAAQPQSGFLYASATNACDSCTALGILVPSFRGWRREGTPATPRMRLI